MEKPSQVLGAHEDTSVLLTGDDRGGVKAPNVN